MQNPNTPAGPAEDFVLCSGTAGPDCYPGGAANWELATAQPMVDPPGVPGFVYILGNPKLGQAIKQPVGTVLAISGLIDFAGASAENCAFCGGGGGGGSPASPAGAVQFNLLGTAFGGSQYFTFDNTADQLTIGNPAAGGPVGITTPSLNAVVYASQQAGADLGAKINAADALLGAGAGEIWVDGLSGFAITTPVTLSATHILRFTQGGTYVLSSVGACGTTTGAICMAANSTIAGSAGAMAVNTTPAVMLQVAASASVNAVIAVNGPYAAIQDIVLDGNCLPPWTSCNAPASGSGIVTTSLASRLEISRVASGNFHTNGATLTAAGSPKIFKLITYQNFNDGLYCNGSAANGNDGFVLDSEFENNGGNGLELNGCSAWRITHNDFGNNSKLAGSTCSLNVYGNASFGSNVEFIVSNQFGNEYHHALCINGYASGDNTAVGSNIIGNNFIGSQLYAANNTYSEILLQDGGNNIITGNVFAASGGLGAPIGSPCYPDFCDNLAAVNATETAGGRSLGNRIIGNVYVDTADNSGAPNFGTGRVVDATVTNGSVCSLIATNDIAISTGWGTGAAVGSISGYAPNCVFTITSGSGSFLASPTVTFTFPGSFQSSLNQAPACQLNVVAITGSGGAIIFNPNVSITAAQWTAQTSTGTTFTPAASETYKVSISCSP